MYSLPSPPTMPPSASPSTPTLPTFSSTSSSSSTAQNKLPFISDEELDSFCVLNGFKFGGTCGQSSGIDIDDLLELNFTPPGENGATMPSSGSGNGGSGSSNSKSRKRKVSRKAVGKGTKSSALSRRRTRSGGGGGGGEQLKHCLRCRNKVPASELKNRYCVPCTDRGVTCRDSFCQLRGDNLVRYGCCLMHCMNRCTYNILHPEHVSLDQHGAQQRVNEFNEKTSDHYMIDSIKYEPMYFRFRHEMSEKYNYMCIEDLKIAADLRIRYSDSSSRIVRNRSLPAFRIVKYVSGKAGANAAKEGPFMQLRSVEKTFSDLIGSMIISQHKVVEAVDLVGLGFMRSRHVYNVYRNILPFTEEVKIVNNKPYMSEETGSTCYLYKPVKQREISCAYTTLDENGNEVVAHVLRFESKPDAFLFGDEKSNNTTNNNGNNKAECSISVDVRGNVTMTLRGYTVPHDVYAFTMCSKTGKARIIV